MQKENPTKGITYVEDAHISAADGLVDAFGTHTAGTFLMVLEEDAQTCWENTDQNQFITLVVHGTQIKYEIVNG